MRLFIQGENIVGVQVIEVVKAIQVREILHKAAEFGFPIQGAIEEAWIGLEDKDEHLHLDEWLQVEDGEDVRLHFHRSHRLAVTCMFNGESRTKNFRPSSTVQSVKEWATGSDGFDLSPVDAADHVLQVCDGDVRPSDSVHIGTLVQHPDHSLCLQLVPADRHQG